MRNIESIIDYSRKFLKRNYNLELTHEMKINGRLTSAYGHVKWLHDYSDVIEISIAKRVVEYGHDLVLLDTIKHELIHYALWKLGKPFEDGDSYFQRELTKHNADGSCDKYSVGHNYSYKCIRNNCTRSYNVKKKGVWYCHCDNDYTKPLKLVAEYFSDGVTRNIIKEFN